MNQDLLKEATRALREAGDDAEPNELTRARVMRSLHAKRRTRRSRLAFGLPLVAVFVAGAAAAQISGALPRAIDRAAHLFGAAEPQSVETGGSEAAKAPGGGQPAGASAVPPAEPVAAPAEPAVSLAEPDAAAPIAAAHSGVSAGVPEQPRAEAPRRPGRRALAAGGDAPRTSVPPAANGPSAQAEQPEVRAGGPSAVVPESAAPAAPVDAAHARYQEAHAAHFSARDYARAVGLWDRYLKEFPRGRFATEAHYNRALCLVRLGRRAEAKAALSPFASGRYGGYRQAEAAALLKALGE